MSKRNRTIAAIDDLFSSPKKLEDLPADVYPIESDDIDTVTDPEVLAQVKRGDKIKEILSGVQEEDTEGGAGTGDPGSEGTSEEGTPDVDKEEDDSTGVRETEDPITATLEEIEGLLLACNRAKGGLLLYGPSVPVVIERITDTVQAARRQLEVHLGRLFSSSEGDG